MKPFIHAAILALSLLLVGEARAHDPAYAKSVVKTLASAEYWGRGYTRDGMDRAAGFIAEELRRAKIPTVAGKTYRQSFRFGVNTFPGRMRVELDGRELVPGLDYIVAPTSTGRRLSGKLVRADDGSFSDPSAKLRFVHRDKLTWSVGRKTVETTEILLNRKRVPANPTSFSVDIENEWVPEFSADNVVGFLPGKSEPEKIVVLTAHYDHLGGMGRETFFPGANDNASGTAYVLALARHYAVHRPDFSVAFLFFGAEEAGLVGSKHFVENPWFKLEQIRFLSNFDLVGTGEDGATVVNATEYPAAFASLQEINSELDAFVRIQSRGKAPNSDHYWFSERGVPAFFFYTMGGIQAYHDVDDRAETLPFTKYRELFGLFLKFNERIVRSNLR